MLSSKWTKDISVVADINSTLLQGSNLLLEREVMSTVIDCDLCPRMWIAQRVRFDPTVVKPHTRLAIGHSDGMNEPYGSYEAVANAGTSQRQTSTLFNTRGSASLAVAHTSMRYSKARQSRPLNHHVNIPVTRLIKSQVHKWQNVLLIPQWEVGISTMS
jgi:hypothetical protein